MKTFLVLHILCVIFGASTEAARILGIFHVPTQSHFIIGHTLLKGLADKGHDVTIASPFPSKDKSINYKEIYLDGLHEIGDGTRKQMFEVVNGSPTTIFQIFANFSNTLAVTTIKKQGIEKLIKSGDKFDVIIVDNFGNEAFFGLAHIFNAHTIVLSTGGSDMANHLVGNVAPYAFVPSVLTTFSDKMTFVQRAINAAANLLVNFYAEFLIFPAQKQLYEELFKDVPPFEETRKNVSLVFVNSHVIFETPRPYLPNMIPIGGVHVNEPKKLPERMQKVLDSTKEGVIYFSLGSNLNSKDLPPHKVDAILKTFAKFPQKVFWKYEDENLKKKLPKNVEISKWYPQSDILAHPNLKLFITHGGLLSSTEAVYRGVPIIGIPVYGDQYANIAKLVSSGYGQQMFLDDLTEESFTAVIREVLENSSYREIIKQSSAILKDQPQHPLERAIFWVEHVVRTNGARHLRSAAVDLSLLEYLLLDVLAFAGVVAGTFVAGIYLVVKTLCCGRKERTDETDKKKERKRKTKKE